MTTVAQQASAAHKSQAQVIGEDTPTASVFVFARNLGNSQRKCLADSEPLAKAYAKASEAAQKAMRFEFLIGFVTGALNTNRDSAETIIEGRVRFGANPQPKKPARTKDQQQAFDSARKMFSFHIARTDSRLSLVRQVPRIRLTAAFKTAAIAFVEQFYEEVNVASINEIIKQLQALKTRLPVKETAEN